MIVEGGVVAAASVLRAGSEGSACGSPALSWRLRGVRAPAVRLPFAPGEALPGSMVSLAELARRRSLAVFFYDRFVPEGAGDEDVELEQARTEGWREREPELEGLGYEIVGVSTQSPEAQAQFALDRMLSFAFLSDSRLLLADELGLPTRSGPAGERMYEPLTILVEDGRIAQVFYPLRSPRLDAEIVTAWIKRRRV